MLKPVGADNSVITEDCMAGLLRVLAFRAYKNTLYDVPSDNPVMVNPDEILVCDMKLAPPPNTLGTADTS